MPYCMFLYTVYASFGRSELFILHLSARTFSGLDGKAIPPPVKFTPAFRRGWNLTIGLFCFTRCIATTWNFGKKLEESALLLRVLFSVFAVWRYPDEALKLSVSFLIMLPTFYKRGSKDVSAIVDCPHVRWICLSLPISLGGPHSCLRIVLSSDRSSGGVLFGGSWFSISSL